MSLKPIDQVVTEALDKYRLNGSLEDLTAVIIDELNEEGYVIVPIMSVLDISPIKTPDPNMGNSLVGRCGKAEEKLKQIGKVYNTETKMERGSECTHARYNLEGAIYDLERDRKANDVVMATLNRIVDQLAEVETILGEDLIWEPKPKLKLVPK